MILMSCIHKPGGKKSLSGVMDLLLIHKAVRAEIHPTAFHVEMQ